MPLALRLSEGLCLRARRSACGASAGRAGLPVPERRMRGTMRRTCAPRARPVCDLPAWSNAGAMMKTVGSAATDNDSQVIGEGASRRSEGSSSRGEPPGASRAEEVCWQPFAGITFELSGRRRQDARPGPVKMYRVPPARAWWPAVGAPLERGVRPRSRRCAR